MSTFAVIKAGEEVVRKIKLYFYEDKKWDANLAFEIAEKFTQLKKATRPFYPGMDEVEFLRKLEGYSKQGMMDAFEIHADKEASACKKDGQPNAITTLLKCSTESRLS